MGRNNFDHVFSSISRVHSKKAKLTCIPIHCRYWDLSKEISAIRGCALLNLFEIDATGMNLNMSTHASGLREDLIKWQVILKIIIQSSILNNSQLVCIQLNYFQYCRLIPTANGIERYAINLTRWPQDQEKFQTRRGNWQNYSDTSKHL